MTTFGYNSFKQNVLEFITSEAKSANLDTFEAIEETMEVISHLALSAFRKDDALNKLYEKAKSDARTELISKLK